MTMFQTKAARGILAIVFVALFAVFSITPEWKYLQQYQQQQQQQQQVHTDQRATVATAKQNATATTRDLVLTSSHSSSEISLSPNSKDTNKGTAGGPFLPATTKSGTTDNNNINNKAVAAPTESAVDNGLLPPSTSAEKKGDNTVNQGQNPETSSQYGESKESVVAGASVDTKLAALETATELATKTAAIPAASMSQQQQRSPPSQEWIAQCVAEVSSIHNKTDPGPFHVVSGNAIGDCLKLCQCFRKKKDWTINSRYRERACASKHTRQLANLSLVSEIQLDQAQKFPSLFAKPANDTLVIHLRLGDAIEQSPQDVVTLLTRGGNPALKGAYATSIKSAAEYIQDIQTSGMHEVAIVGGSHKPQFYQKSRIYAECLYRAIQQAGYTNVTMTIEGNHPDVDFYFMTHAKKIVVSAGGFSNLIGLFAEQRGGEIVGRKFQSQFVDLPYFQQQRQQQNGTNETTPSQNTNTEGVKNGNATKTPKTRRRVSVNPRNASSIKVLKAAFKPVGGSAASRANASQSDRSWNSSRWHPSGEWLDNCSTELSRIEGGPFEVVANNAIGDCIKHCHCYQKPQWTMNYQYQASAFCQSKSNQQLANLTIIDKIHRMQEEMMKNKQLPENVNLIKPDNDTLVLHLRLGDVIEKKVRGVPRLLEEGGNPAHSTPYANSIKSVHEYLENIAQAGVSKVSIIGGSHMAEMYRKSRVYAGCLHRAIQHAGYNVTMRIEGTHPDVDFYYMSHAKKIVVSSGGFSNLIGLLVEHRGGEIVGRSFQSEFLELPFFAQDDST